MKGVVISDSKADLGRKKDLVFNLSYFLNERSHVLEVVNSEEFIRNWKSYDFVYKPITVGSVSKLDGNKFDIPIIIDRADSKAPTMTGVFSKYLIRSAFGQSKNSIKMEGPCGVIPLIPPPVPVEILNADTSGDIISFDLKPFHEQSTVLQAAGFLALLCEKWDAIVEKLGFEPRLYFTSFFDFDIVFELVNTFKPNIKRNWFFDEVKNKVMAAAEDSAEYQAILSDTFLFFTEHGDLADWDVSFVQQLGKRVVAYNRGLLGRSTGIQSVIPNAWGAYVEEFPSVLMELNKNFRGMESSLDSMLTFNSNSYVFPRKNYLSAYMGSLDDGFRFLRGESLIENITEICTSGFKWNKGVCYS